MPSPLNPLEVLLELHLSGSLAQSAGRMGKSSSALSKTIRMLELQVGQALVEHTARPLRLTEAGRAYAEAARQMRGQLRETENQIAAASRQPAGSLRVTASLLFGHVVLADYVVAFRRQYPAVRLEVVLSDEYVDVSRDDFDLAIRHGRRATGQMIARPLGRNRVRLCATPAYFRRVGLPEHPEQLARHECLNYRADTLDSRWRFHRGAESLYATPIARLASNSDDFLLASMRAGDGLLPCFEWAVGPELRDGRLQSCLDDWRFESDAFGDAELWAVYPSGQRGKPKVRDFVDGLALCLEQRTGAA